LKKSENAAALSLVSGQTHSALSGDGGAIDTITKAASALDSLTDADETFAGFATTLRETTYVLEDISRETITYRDSIDFDSETLAADQERMAALQSLMRTYGPRMEEVFLHRAGAAEVVSLVDDGALRQEQANTFLAQAEEELIQAARALENARGKAAPLFARSVNEQMKRLEMGSVSFLVQIDSLKRSAWTKAGSTRIEFMLQHGEGMQARPLARIASGGEMSRIMLAIKVVLGNADHVETLIFDEVDAGVGGAVAVALASVLVDLAKSHQVIAVTHMPQIAVAGDTHYVVAKKEGKPKSDKSGEHASMPETIMSCLTQSERVLEIARMLSGEVTTLSLEHAQEMLERAAKSR
jgi:DNA repair protein RecN (Recombination protein N)